MPDIVQQSGDIEPTKKRKKNPGKRERDYNKAKKAKLAANLSNIPSTPTSREVAVGTNSVTASGSAGETQIPASAQTSRDGPVGVQSESVVVNRTQTMVLPDLNAILAQVEPMLKSSDLKDPRCRLSIVVLVLHHYLYFFSMEDYPSASDYLHVIADLNDFIEMVEVLSLFLNLEVVRKTRLRNACPAVVEDTTSINASKVVLALATPWTVYSSNPES